MNSQQTPSKMTDFSKSGSHWLLTKNRWNWPTYLSPILHGTFESTDWITYYVICVSLCELYWSAKLNWLKANFPRLLHTYNTSRSSLRHFAEQATTEYFDRYVEAQEKVRVNRDDAATSASTKTCGVGPVHMYFFLCLYKMLMLALHVWVGPEKGSSGESLSHSKKNVPVISRSASSFSRAKPPSAWWLCDLNLSLGTMKWQIKRKDATN